MTTNIRITPGYARRWIKRNWYKALSFAGWLAAGILIRAGVAAGRPESWPVGGEIIPAAACWVMAGRVALGECPAKTRR